MPLRLGLDPRRSPDWFRPSALLVAVALLTTVAACGGSATSPGTNGASGPVGTSGPAGAGVTVVQMTNQLTYDPADVTIKIGATVRWENVASMDHTSTDDSTKAPDPKDAALPAGADPWDSTIVPAGGTFEHTFTVAGDYTYFCIPHASAGMVGHIHVTP